MRWVLKWASHNILEITGTQAFQVAHVINGGAAHYFDIGYQARTFLANSRSTNEVIHRYKQAVELIKKDGSEDMCKNDSLKASPTT